jgi:hypothetical protein
MTRLIFLAIVLSLAPQSQGSVFGTVTDNSGAVLPDFARPRAKQST